MRLHHQTNELYRLAHQLSKKLRMSTVSRDFVGSNRVLSIQSHPVFGYVGNKAAVFPMQVLGMDVDPIHTVVLSNHGGYPSTRGEQTSSHVLSDIITGLQENNLLNYDYILSKRSMHDCTAYLEFVTKQSHFSRLQSISRNT